VDLKREALQFESETLTTKLNLAVSARDMAARDLQEIDDKVGGLVEEPRAVLAEQSARLEGLEVGGRGEGGVF
jgi:hypothetical protein